MSCAVTLRISVPGIRGKEYQEECQKKTRTGPLDIDEVDIVGRSMYHGPESHRICNLSVEPDVLIGREEPAQFWADEANNIAQHGEEDQAPIEGENETGTTRSPD